MRLVSIKYRSQFGNGKTVRRPLVAVSWISSSYVCMYSRITSTTSVSGRRQSVCDACASNYDDDDDNDDEKGDDDDDDDHADGGGSIATAAQS